MKRAFTLLELVMVLVVIGILSSFAIPKFKHLRENAKITSELSTASAVQSALDECHGEWIVNESNFTCGYDIPSSDLNSYGYPNDLGNPLDKILKNASNIGWREDNGRYYGPASDGGVPVKNPDIAGKPDSNDYWEYNSTTGTFKLIDN